MCKIFLFYQVDSFSHLLLTSVVKNTFLIGWFGSD